jgi:hypothetical protein
MGLRRPGRGLGRWLHTASFWRPSDTVIRHAPPTPIRAVVVAVIETSFGTLLMASARRSRATAPRGLSAREVAVAIPSVAPPAKVEDPLTFLAPMTTNRIHFPRRRARKLILAIESWDLSNRDPALDRRRLGATNTGPSSFCRALSSRSPVAGLRSKFRRFQETINRLATTSYRSRCGAGASLRLS